MRELEEKMAAATAKYKARREVKKGKGNASSLEAIFQDALREYHPTAPAFAWRVKDLAAMKRAFTRVVPSDEWKAVLTFIVREWKYIHDVEFKWMKTLPVTPHLPVVISHLDKLYLLHVSLASGSKSLFEQANEKTTGAGEATNRLTDTEAQLRAANDKLLRANHEIRKLKQRAKPSDGKTLPKKTRSLKKPGSVRGSTLGNWDD